jgi:hypothetical protein
MNQNSRYQEAVKSNKQGIPHQLILPGNDGNTNYPDF